MSPLKLVMPLCAILMMATVVFSSSEHMAYLNSKFSAQEKSGKIYLTSGVVDTQQHASLRSTLGSSHYSRVANPPPREQFMVHLKPHALQSAQKDIEAKIGHPLSYYLPHNTFLMVTSLENALEVENLDGVLWVGRYREEYKVEPALSASPQEYLCENREQGSVHVTFAPNMAVHTEFCVQLARDTGLTLLDHSDTGVVLRGSCAEVANALPYLQQQPEVHWIERAPEYRLLNKYAHGIVQGGVPFKNDIWARGLKGDGQVVGCADTGLDTSLCWFNDTSMQRVNNVVNMNSRKVVLYQIIVDDTAEQGDHGTHVVGSICGQALNASSPQASYDGMAPGAKVAFQDIGGADGSLSVPSNLNTSLFPMPYFSANARIRSDSWGEERNTYSSHAQQIDQFSWDHASDFLSVWAAGNSGTQGLFSVGAPATAKNTLAVGASMSSYLAFEDYQSLSLVGVQRTSPSVGAVITGVMAVFGPRMTRISGQLVSMTPEDGCSSAPAGFAAGKIAIVARGDCLFQVKARNAQNAGAIAVIVTNNVPGEAPFAMGMGDNLPVSIPSIMVSLTDGNTLRGYAAGSVVVIDPELVRVNLNGSAIFSQNNLAYFSSRGPTADGRFKPDVVAPGMWIFSANSAGDDPIASKCSVKPMQGTSMATPITAGTVALVREYFMDGYYPSGVANASAAFTPSGPLMKAMMIHSTVDMTGVIASDVVLSTSISNNPLLQGFGRIQVDNVLHFSDSTFNLYVENLKSISAGQTQSFCFQVTSTTQPFKVTLVWHDYPADMAAMMSLVNDLNLMVVPPTGSPLIGNSVQRNDATLFDNINNVEVVSVANPVVGMYTVVVMGASVPRGPQPYALVVTGDMTTVTCGAVSCPNACSSHGTCTGAMCLCDAGYSGIDCSSVVPVMDVNDTLTNVPLGSYEWKYYGIRVPASSVGQNLAVQFSRTGGNGDPDLYMKFGALPSFESYDYRNLDCDPCGTTTHSVLIPSAQLMAGTYYVGMFGYCCTSSTFSLRVITPQLCAETCQNGGSCNYETGTCVCTAGFTGLFCTDSGLAAWKAVLIALGVLAFGVIVFIVLFCRARIARFCRGSRREDASLTDIPMHGMQRSLTQYAPQPST